MDVADPPRERGAHPVVGPRSAVVRDRRVHRPEPARRGPAPVPQEPPPRPHTDIAADDADHRQADYFVSLLGQRRRLVGHRIDEYRRAIAAAEAKGDAGTVCEFRRLTRVEELELQALNAMLDKLSRRFARRAVATGPGVAAL